ncbi:MAG: hypothetical protein QXS74_09685 [Nitrososphaeria archaeon]
MKIGKLFYLDYEVVEKIKKFAEKYGTESNVIKQAINVLEKAELQGEDIKNMLNDIKGKIDDLTVKISSIPVVNIDNIIADLKTTQEYLKKIARIWGAKIE